ncbi:MAG: hypothetical protein KC800_14790, partial [Candidatus Eremiobacteraeota bacterium]|nr:hypothetical protein [Candidatus Eremiobacteraeota bacterium]
VRVGMAMDSFLGLQSPAEPAGGGSFPRNVNRTMLAPYRLETVYLPAHLDAALDRTQTAPLPTYEPLPLSPVDSWERFAGLRNRVAGRLEALATVSRRMTERITPEDGLNALHNHKEREPDLLLEQYRIYDEFFGVRRAGRLSAEELECQFARTIAALLSDLPQTNLARDTLDHLLAGIEFALDRFAPLPETALESSAWELAEALEVVRFRWNTGHHLFALMNHLAGDAFARAAHFIEEPARCAGEIRRSEVFLRASSAAMEYTVNFPSRYYREVIRPEMDASPIPGGFSGTQNADYNHMKVLKGKLQAMLVLRYTRFTERWPEEILSAVKSYRAADLLDLDVHIRVAAFSVGLGPSLKQRKAQEAGVNALEALRRMMTQRLHDFGL